MNRADSAFDETFRTKATKTDGNTVRRYNTASSRTRKHKQALTDLDRKDQISSTPSIRPASDKPIPAQRKSTETRQKSITTTSSNSAKSRKHGHGSAPSSRRTSCTVVDPSRPTRHYRIKSSQTCPSLNRDIDDVLALHFRSCSLFQNSTYQPSLPSPTMSAYGPSVGAEIGAAAATQGPLPQASTHESDLPVVNEKARPLVGVEDTTMHWMLPSTRKSQYAKIDRANTGFRGLMRRFMPRSISDSGPQRFYEEEKSDAGSVRRYRMDVSDGEDGDAKSTSGLKVQRRKLERSTTHTMETSAKRFGCF
ncbi:hypothetical protein BU23DRAFT_104139 [Bimuria novae-zelandiae CBS 107.79]|uniref:Uncharacterized protein n=1 Tax=Bimuria novae-zelandiae CBS 107.79 TaxID=1447943 RepID=A0A6A5VSK9_9PLEO|nr:hypothetical protein BU23DRAFT_104139 [Bimuria novae-zelandiae CBS 107.79]